MPSPSQPRHLTVLHYDYVDDVLERRGPHREAHLALLAAWRDAGRLVMGGAVGDPPHGGLMVFDGDQQAARELVDADPYVANGLVRAWRTEPWTVVV